MDKDVEELTEVEAKLVTLLLKLVLNDS